VRRSTLLRLEMSTESVDQLLHAAMVRRRRRTREIGGAKSAW
jgi:hypothetical protein